MRTLKPYSTVRLVFDRRKQSSNTKPGKIEVEILFEKKRKWISTGVQMLPDNWRDGQVSGRMDALDMNLTIIS